MATWGSSGAGCREAAAPGTGLSSGGASVLPSSLVASVGEAMLALAARQSTGRGQQPDLDATPSSGASGTGEDTHDRD